MTLEGELTVRLAWDRRRVRDVAIRSSRPFAIGRVLAGRSPGDACAMVPRLFSVCGGAQGAAAATALDAASARASTPDEVAARETTAVLEAVQEHFWRLLIDWPKAMRRAPATQEVAAGRHAIAPALAQLAADPLVRNAHGTDPQMLLDVAHALARLAAEHLYGMPPEDWVALRSTVALDAWTARGATLPAVLLHELRTRKPRLGASDVALMPAATSEALVASIVPALQHHPEFARAPVWHGAPVETGALARLQAHPLVAAVRARDGNSVTTRMVARLAELALLLSRLDGAAAIAPEPPAVRGLPLGAGEGLAAVETARGLLLHRVRVAAGKIVSYDIVAPTEWNFHPAGALARGLALVEATDEPALVRDARLAVQALDPCVACHIEVGHA